MRRQLLFTLLFFCLFGLTDTVGATSVAGYLEVDRNDNTPDLPCTAAANDCSLYSAIQIARSNGTDIVDFIAFADDYVIVLDSELPRLSTGNIWLYAAPSRTVTVVGLPQKPVFSIDSDTITIEGLHIYNDQGTAIRVSNAAATDVTIRRNEIGRIPNDENCSGLLTTGISVQETVGPLWIYDNDIQCINTHGVHVYPPARQVHIGEKANGDMAGNLIRRTGQDDGAFRPAGVRVVGVGLGSGAQEGHVVRGNRVEDNAKFGLHITGAYGTVVAQNGFYRNDIGIQAQADIFSWFYGNIIADNAQDGLRLEQSSQRATIGCAEAGPFTPLYRNYIYGNGNAGVYTKDSSDNAIRCNFIGTMSDGTTAAGNTGHGVYINQSYDTVVGGAAGAGNVIAANLQSGVKLRQSNRVQVIGNQIGVATDETGLGNGEHGVHLDDAADSTIGGGNVIGANTLDGIFIENSSGTSVVANQIGTNATGFRTLGNGAAGIRLSGGAVQTRIGDATSDSANLIGHNQVGIWLDNSGAGNELLANYIGRWPSDNQPHPNSTGIYNDETDGTLIGLGCSEPCLFASGNSNHGIQLRNSADLFIGDNTVIEENGNIGIQISGELADSILFPHALVDNAAGGIRANQPLTNVLLRPNQYQGLDELPIDHLADGATPNSADDGVMDYPLISQQNGTLITGAACDACFITIYSAEFSDFYGTIISATQQAVLPTDDNGQFTIELADYGLTADTVALTASDGNTSEMVGLIESVPTAVSLSTMSAALHGRWELVLMTLLLFATVVLARVRLFHV